MKKESTSKNSFKQWWQSGLPWIWLNAGAVSISIVVVFGLLFMIAVKGMGHFWPSNVYQFDYHAKSEMLTSPLSLIGEFVEFENVEAERYIESGLGEIPGNEPFVKRWLIKTGNREILSADFRWIDDFRIENKTAPEDLIVIERIEWGNLWVSEADQ